MHIHPIISCNQIALQFRSHQIMLAQLSQSLSVYLPDLLFFFFRNRIKGFCVANSERPTIFFCKIYSTWWRLKKHRGYSICKYVHFIERRFISITTVWQSFEWMHYLHSFLYCCFFYIVFLVIFRCVCMFVLGWGCLISFFGWNDIVCKQ